MNDHRYPETHGQSVLVCETTFHDVFRDQKLGGVEMILHGECIDAASTFILAANAADAVAR